MSNCDSERGLVQFDCRIISCGAQSWIFMRGVLLCMTSKWSGCETLSKIVSSLVSVLSDTTVRESLHSDNVTSFVDQLVKSVCVCHPQPAGPACNSIEDSMSHHILIENPEPSPADVDRPQRPQITLDLPVESVSVVCQVQFTVNVYPRVLVGLHGWRQGSV